MDTTRKKAILASAKLLAVSLVLSVAGCSLFPVSIEARLGDFFDDLEDASSDSDYGDLVDRHIHPDAARFSQAKSAEWWDGTFLGGDGSDYSWSVQDNSESSEFSGSRRVEVSVDVNSISYDDTVFYMKQDGSDWKIRAIYESVALEDDDDPLLESVVDPSSSPVRE
ncbi:MAG: hypothetical protein ACOC0B_01350 [bacterium]